MNFTLPKNRIAPIILFAIISLVVSFILGTYQINKILQYSYEEKLSTYDSLTENMVSLIKKDIMSQFQSLQDSAELAARLNELNKDNIEDILPKLAKDEAYLDLIIVNKDGKGYNLKGNYVDASAQSYFIQAIKGNVNVSD